MSQLGVANIENPGDAVKEGQALDLKVLEVDPIHHRIVLAVIGLPRRADHSAGQAGIRGKHHPGIARRARWRKGRRNPKILSPFFLSNNSFWGGEM